MTDFNGRVGISGSESHHDASEDGWWMLLKLFDRKRNLLPDAKRLRVEAEL